MHCENYLTPQLAWRITLIDDLGVLAAQVTGTTKSALAATCTSLLKQAW